LSGSETHHCVDRFTRWVSLSLNPSYGCGNGPELWLRMQQTYDLGQIELAMRKEIAKIPTVRKRPHNNVGRISRRRNAPVGKEWRITLR
jgi:hypothetical protein